MHTLKMEDRVISSSESIDPASIAQCEPVNRKELDDNLEKFRELSAQFLSKALDTNADASILQ